ncbi:MULTISPECIES: lysozyme inhibitor LprI family protein [unclassified Agarivorans]|uniref:lysozyme inhibitor LprI family protein n=1 Tax=unclassified Agarivorans TaxID=2636026 RepID=UPI003D7E7FFD
MMNRYWCLLGLCFVFLVSATEQTIDCEKAYSTLDINYCAGIELDLAEQQMQRYLATSLKHNEDDPELLDAIKLAQQDWRKYYKSHCDSVYTQWREGSIRGVMALSCKTKLTKLRTHQLWENFLTYMDSTPPVLPEPKR